MYRAYGYVVCRSVFHAYRKAENHGSDEHVTWNGEIYLFFYQVTDTYGTNHSVKDEAYTADGGAGHQCYEAREFRTERQYDSEYRCDADNARVEYTGDVKHSGVLAVSGVGRCSEQRCDEGSNTVAAEGAVQTGLAQEVLAYGRRYGAHIAYVFHHGSEGYRCDGHDRRDNHGLIGVVEYGERSTFAAHGEACPCGFAQWGEVYLTAAGGCDVRQ